MTRYPRFRPFFKRVWLFWKTRRRAISTPSRCTAWESSRSAEKRHRRLRRSSPAEAYLRLGQGGRARYSRANQAQAIGSQGDARRELALLRACLEEARFSDDKTHQSLLLTNIANAHANLSEWEEAHSVGVEGVRLCVALGNLRTLGFLFWNLPEALLHKKNSEPERTVRLMGFATRFWIERMGDLSESDLKDIETVKTGAGEFIDESAVESLWAEGESLTLAEALVLATGDASPGR